MGNYYPSHNYGPEHAALLASGDYLPQPTPKRGSKRRPSEAQLAANRANAQKSTGPRTPEGKTRCSMNAYRSGITGQVSALTEEDRAAQSQFTTPIVESLQPATPLERQIAQSIAEGHWRLSRVRAMEDNLFALGHFSPAAGIDVDHPELHSALTSAQVFLEQSKTFERLTLYEQRIQRGVEKHMRELQALQSTRKAAHEAALAEAAILLQLDEFEEETPEIGSEFSPDQIRAHIRRKDRLTRARFHERCDWDVEIPYPHTA